MDKDDVFGFVWLICSYCTDLTHYSSCVFRCFSWLFYYYTSLFSWNIVPHILYVLCWLINFQTMSCVARAWDFGHGPRPGKPMILAPAMNTGMFLWVWRLVSFLFSSSLTFVVYVPLLRVYLTRLKSNQAMWDHPLTQPQLKII